MESFAGAAAPVTGTAGAPGNAGHLCEIVRYSGAPEPAPPAISQRCAPLRRQQAGRSDSACATSTGRKNEYTTAANTERADSRRMVLAYTDPVCEVPSFSGTPAYSSAEAWASYSSKTRPVCWEL